MVFELNKKKVKQILFPLDEICNISCSNRAYFELTSMKIIPEPFHVSLIQKKLFKQCSTSTINCKINQMYMQQTKLIIAIRIIFLLKQK